MSKKEFFMVRDGVREALRDEPLPDGVGILFRWEDSDSFGVCYLRFEDGSRPQLWQNGPAGRRESGRGWLAREIEKTVELARERSVRTREASE